MTLNINDNVYEKVMYLLDHLKGDIQIIKNEELNIEQIDENDPDYKIVAKGREERQKHPENYVSGDSIDWN